MSSIFEYANLIFNEFSYVLSFMALSAIIFPGIIYVFRTFWDSFGLVSSNIDFNECVTELSKVNDKINEIGKSTTFSKIEYPKRMKCKYCDSIFVMGTYECKNCGGILKEITE